MAIGATFADDLLLLIFQATTIANLAINATSSPITSLFVGLHTADPSAGDQTTSEISYTTYARIGVVRSNVGWTVSGANVVNAGAVTFGACTAGSATASYVSIGKSVSGTGEVYYSGALTTPLAISVGITPSFAASALSLTLS